MIISGGGTGGHVYPALAIVEALTATGLQDVSLLYVGSEGGVEEELARRQGIAFRAIAAGQVRGLMPWTMARNLMRIARGLFQARRIVGEFAPRVVLVTGGYVCVPVALAAWARRIPVLIYLPDLEPGLAIRVLSRFAARVAVSFPEVARYFGAGKAVVTGYPVRAAFFAADKAAARATFALETGKGKLVINNNHRRERTSKIDAMEKELTGCFTNQYLAGRFLRQIRKRFPRYARDQFMLIKKTIDRQDQNLVDQTLLRCLDLQLFSGGEFKSVFHHLLGERKKHVSVSIGEYVPLMPGGELDKILLINPKQSAVSDYQNLLI